MRSIIPPGASLPTKYMGKTISMMNRIKSLSYLNENKCRSLYFIWPMFKIFSQFTYSAVHKQ